MTDWLQYALAKPGAWRDQPFGDELADALDTSYELVVAKLPRRIRDQLS